MEQRPRGRVWWRAAEQVRGGQNCLFICPWEMCLMGMLGQLKAVLTCLQGGG